jgi:hypothetical protein
MNKIAWPWIGDIADEMGSMAPKGEFTDMIQDSSAPYDMLAPEKHIVDTGVPSMQYSEGMISPVQNMSDDNKSGSAHGFKYHTVDDNSEELDQRLINAVKHIEAAMGEINSHRSEHFDLFSISNRHSFVALFEYGIVVTTSLIVRIKKSTDSGNLEEITELIAEQVQKDRKSVV